MPKEKTSIWIQLRQIIHQLKFCHTVYRIGKLSRSRMMIFIPFTHVKHILYWIMRQNLTENERDTHTACRKKLLRSNLFLERMNWDRNKFLLMAWETALSKLHVPFFRVCVYNPQMWTKKFMAQDSIWLTDIHRIVSYPHIIIIIIGCISGAKSCRSLLSSLSNHKSSREITSKLQQQPHRSSSHRWSTN